MPYPLIGKTVRVNLTTSEVKVETTHESDVLHFLGGRGINMLELYRNLPNPGSVDPLGPENVLIIGVGLLTGTSAPNAARFNVSAKSPETGILGDANGGGFFGPAMKFAGYDRIIVSGKAENPVYILLEEDHVEIKDASHLWGLDTQTTQQVIWDTEGEEVEAACIGPAGEHMVKFACVMNRVKNSASRGGMGAVMGSKNLKAVVARGTGALPLHDPKKFMDTVFELKDYLNGSRIVQTLRKVGTPLLYEPSHILGTIRSLNSQQTRFKDTLKAEEFLKFSKGAMACASCVVHCRHANAQGGEGPEYSTIGLLGANCGIGDANHVNILNNMCNTLGLDTSSTGSVIAWFLEMAQRGILPDGLGEGLEFGNFALMQSLLYKISYRDAVGDWIADSYTATSRLPENVREEARSIQIQSKGLPQSDPHDCRYIKAFALGIGTASRGADHLRSRATIELFDLPEELTTDIYGKPVNTIPYEYQDKGWIVAMHESIYAVGDALGICRFVTHSFNSPHLLKYEHFADLVQHATGLEIEDYRLLGDRIVNLERMFNMKCGVDRSQDYPPRRYMTEPATAGIAKGHLIDPDRYEEMLDDFYAARGWSRDGVPSDRQKEEITRLVEVLP
ncbi:MAG: aldehyde ferredoxin oxidoreductase family protein [Candidatus Kariarchaeaceae archaeon]